jgi:hypothetical protein
MIAISSVVGVGLFLQTGKVEALAGAGGSVVANLIAILLVRAVARATIVAIKEMTTLFPIEARLLDFSGRTFSPTLRRVIPKIGRCKLASESMTLFRPVGGSRSRAQLLMFSVGFLAWFADHLTFLEEKLPCLGGGFLKGERGTLWLGTFVVPWVLICAGIAAAMPGWEESSNLFQQASFKAQQPKTKYRNVQLKNSLSRANDSFTNQTTRTWRCRICLLTALVPSTATLLCGAIIGLILVKLRPVSPLGYVPEHSRPSSFIPASYLGETNVLSDSYISIPAFGDLHNKFVYENSECRPCIRSKFNTNWSNSTCLENGDCISETSITIFNWPSGPSIYFITADNHLSGIDYMAIDGTWRLSSVGDQQFTAHELSQLAHAAWLNGSSSWIYYQESNTELREYRLDDYREITWRNVVSGPLGDDSKAKLLSCGQLCFSIYLAYYVAAFFKINIARRLHTIFRIVFQWRRGLSSKGSWAPTMIVHWLINPVELLLSLLLKLKSRSSENKQQKHSAMLLSILLLAPPTTARSMDISPAFHVQIQDNAALVCDNEYWSIGNEVKQLLSVS